MLCIAGADGGFALGTRFHRVGSPTFFIPVERPYNKRFGDFILFLGIVTSSAAVDTSVVRYSISDSGVRYLIPVLRINHHDH